jgi:hypothetical protein
MRAILLAALTALTVNALAADAQADKENWFKRAGKAIASDAKAGWHKAKKGYSESAKQIGHDTANATKRVGHEMKDSAKRSGKAAKEEFK